MSLRGRSLLPYEIDTSNSGYILTFSDKGDFLALAIELTLNDVISVLLDIDGDFAEKIAAAKLDDGTMTSSNTLVISSIARLFPIMKEPVYRAFMEKHIISRKKLFFISYVVRAEVSFSRVSSIFSRRERFTK